MQQGFRNLQAHLNCLLEIVQTMRLRLGGGKDEGSDDPGIATTQPQIVIDPLSTVQYIFSNYDR